MSSWFLISTQTLKYVIMTKLKLSDFEIENASKNYNFRRTFYSALVVSSLAVATSCTSDSSVCTDSNSGDAVAAGVNCVDSD
ncbi:hypothetical protein GCM10009430_33130 [Aquimarina litoralis]|uniref:Uncharacterized protein n=2 Tax=Aquimarina litoralis TaxID=584605 RepID=A0ABN1J1Z6_9FLAO